MALTSGWILPSKFLLEDAMAATTRSLALMELETSSDSGPEFPMHVMQPYPQTWNPSFSRYTRRPEFCRYWVTTLDPGAREVLT